MSSLSLPKVTIYQPRTHASRHRFRNSKGQRNEISTITAGVSGFYDVFLGAGWQPSLVEIDDKIKAAFNGRLLCLNDKTSDNRRRFDSALDGTL